MTVFWIPFAAFASTAIIVYLALMPRTRDRRVQRRWSADGGGDVTGSSETGGWGLGELFGSHSSLHSHASATDSSGNPADSGGSDSGGGGNGGGDGGGGGGSD